jgi:hypothetical protein
MKTIKPFDPQERNLMIRKNIEKQASPIRVEECSSKNL